MYEDMTAASIQETLLANLKDAGWSDEEGSMAQLLAGPMSQELSKGYQALDAMIPKFWVDDTSGVYIEAAANVMGIYRKEGTCATCTLTLTGTAGTTIAGGTLFLTSDGLSFALDNQVTLDADGTATATATATDVGEAYNIDAGELVKMYTNLSNLTTYTNTAATGGTDVETDAALYARLHTARTTPSTSGNVADYMEWALAISGVGYAKVTPLADGAGTVTVTLADSNGDPVTESIRSEVAAYIETMRPVGPTITVESATGVTVDVAATVTIDSTTTLEQVQADLVSKLDSYFDDLVATWATATGDYTLLYNRIVFHLLDVDGVVDYTALTINEDTSNLALTSSQVPVLGEVTISGTD